MSLTLKNRYRILMEKYSIPYEQAAGMMTSAKLEDMVIVTEKHENIQMMAIVTAEVGTDEITMRSISETNQQHWHH